MQEDDPGTTPDSVGPSRACHGAELARMVHVPATVPQGEDPLLQKRAGIHAAFANLIGYDSAVSARMSRAFLFNKVIFSICCQFPLIPALYSTVVWHADGDTKVVCILASFR